MKAFMEYKHKRAAELDQHDFVKWLDEDNVPIEFKFDFMPIMTLFIMGFRDMNLWVIRFDAQADEHFRGIINGNTREDETHSRLFLEDWDKLDMDRKLGWSAGDTLWWLFIADETECYRRYAVEFVRLAVDDGDDPMLRFTHSEAGEACGHVFFRHSVGPEARLRAATGVEHRYFGDYHLDRELGHVMESEGEFEVQELSPEQRAAGMALGSRMFDIFGGIFDSFHDYAVTYVEAGRVPRPEDITVAAPRRRPCEPCVPLAACGETPHDTSLGLSATGFVAETCSTDRGLPAGPSLSARHLEQRLNARKSRAEQHPFYAWLREHDEVAAADRLRRFIPMWVMDIMGYRDLNHYVYYYDAPTNEFERAINAWVNELETHSVLFLADWQALGMDELLGWGARETLEFCFLDPGMDVHRENIFAFMKLGLRHPDPVLRFWLMYALEASGEAFFANTRALACEAEAAGVGPLDYLGDRHDGGHPVFGLDAESRRELFLQQVLTAADFEVAEHMIAVVFDALEAQLDLSLEAAVNNRFAIPNSGVMRRVAY